MLTVDVVSYAVLSVPCRGFDRFPALSFALTVKIVVAGLTIAMVIVAEIVIPFVDS